MSSGYILTNQIENPTQEQQNKYLIKYLGNIPKEYIYIDKGIISYFINTKLDETWVHVYSEKNRKTVQARLFTQNFKKIKEFP